MAFNEPEEFGEDFPPPEPRERRMPVVLIALAIGVVAMVALLALSY